MHVRVNTVRGASDLDKGTSYLHEKVLPLLHRQAGYRGGMTSVDRAGAVVGVITLWEDKKALEESENVADGSRAEAVRMIGGDVTVETFEQVVGEIGSPPPTEGCLVRFVRACSGCRRSRRPGLFIEGRGPRETRSTDRPGFIVR